MAAEKNGQLPGDVDLPFGDGSGPLEGSVFIELAETLAGEFAGGLLADLGATVIKVEPRGGSPLRRLGPSLTGEDSLYFQSENRGKLSVVAEVDDALLADLLGAADGLLEDLGPGGLEARGLAPDLLGQRNPGLCILRLSPFGQTGPLAYERGNDRIAQAFSGMQFVTGFPDSPPISVTVPLADYWSGILGAAGLLISIFEARRSGIGQTADLALYEAPLRLQEGAVIRYDRSGTVPVRMGTETAGVVPASIYPTSDGGWIALSGAGDQTFARLCEAVEAPEAAKDPLFATVPERLKHRDEANELVGSWIARHTLAEVEERFAALGVTGSGVRSVDEILADPHLQARGAFLKMKSQSGRSFIAPGPVPRFSRTMTKAPSRSPKLGEDTDSVHEAVRAIAGRRRPAVERLERGTGAALTGIRVIDLSQWLAGPVAATILAEFGADVIMVELPAGTDEDRGLPFRVTNRNKRSLSLDVRTPAGRKVLEDLVRASDVLVENFRPGTMERWGLGPETLLALNTRLVFLRASGFGQSGPDAGRAAFNPVGLAVGGLTYLNGWPDRKPLRDGVTAGDYTTALFNVLGVMAALLRRDVDGLGQVVDTSMAEGILRMTGDSLAVRSSLGIRRERAGGAWPVYPWTFTVRSGDERYVSVSVTSLDELSAALDDVTASRADDAVGVQDRLQAFASETPAEEVVVSLRKAGLAASSVNSIADLVDDPQVLARGNIVRVEDREFGEIRVQGVVPGLSRTPGRVSGWSPFPGSDGPAILRGVLGYSEEEIQAICGPTRGVASP